MSTKKDRLNIRIQPELKEKIMEYCKANNMDMSYYIITLMRTHLKKAGYLSVKNKPVLWHGSVDDMPLEM